MVKIDSLMCKGCGYCIRFCPKHILKMSEERSPKGFFFPVNTDENACSGCAVCALMCPEAAIEVSGKEE